MTGSFTLKCMPKTNGPPSRQVVSHGSGLKAGFTVLLLVTTTSKLLPSVTTALFTIKLRS